MTKKIELLAPAGDLERLDTAIYFGADAVYMGGPQLQLRADSVGFTMETLAEGISRAHRSRRKAYVTVNSFVYNDEITTLSQYAKALHDMGADAVIVSDLGAIATIREAVPELEVHVSTQANCLNYAAARVYHDMGAKRIVLAREMSLNEIKRLRDKIPEDLELECFVHGAMCMSYSGRCLLSAFLNNRSGNRGECTQPCRWSYHLVENNRPGEYFEVEESENGTAILSSYDLNCIEFLDELADAGVNSFKIEGRMKSPYYVGTVVNAYRRAMDGTAPLKKLKKELDCVSHRPYSSGFYFGKMKQHNPADGGAYQQDCTFVGVVQECWDGKIRVEQRNRFRIGDELEVVSPHSLGESFYVDELVDEDGFELMSASRPQEMVEMPCSLDLQYGDILRRREVPLEDENEEESGSNKDEQRLIEELNEELGGGFDFM